jgi:hypothetical protein
MIADSVLYSVHKTLLTVSAEILVCVNDFIECIPDSVVKEVIED